MCKSGINIWVWFSDERHAATAPNGQISVQRERSLASQTLGKEGSGQLTRLNLGLNQNCKWPGDLLETKYRLDHKKRDLTDVDAHAWEDPKMVLDCILATLIKDTVDSG